MLTNVGYLTFYLTGNIEEEYVREGEKIGEDLRVMISAYKKMRNSEANLLGKGGLGKKNRKGHNQSSNNVASENTSKTDRDFKDFFDNNSKTEDITKEGSININTSNLKNPSLRHNYQNFGIVINEVNLEKKTGELFTRLEVLIGL